MALNWVNKQDNIDEVMADDVNSLAAAIVENERSIAKETGARSAKDNDLQSQVNKKVDKVEGMGLSSNDYTDEEKQKLGELPINAELRADIEKKADKRTVEGGFAGGDNANTMNGGAVGNSASAGSGGAVGCGAKTGDGFAGGNGAVTVNEKGSLINAIQLGFGTNKNPKTLQVYDYQLMDADGNVPIERMAKEVEAREAKDAELQESINKRVEFEAIYQNELDDCFTVGERIYKIIGRKRPDDGHIIVDKTWRDYYVIVNGWQAGNGEYGSVQVKTGVKGVYVRTGFKNILLHTLTWSDWTEYVTKTELDAEASAREAKDTELQDKINEIKDKTLKTITFKNLLNVNDENYEVGKYVNPNTGKTANNTGYNTTGYISVDTGDTICLSVKSFMPSSGATFRTILPIVWMAFYDDNKAVVKNDLKTSSEKAYWYIPEGVKYVRISFLPSDLSNNELMVEKITQIGISDAYIEYGNEKTVEISLDLSGIDMYLPPYIYAVKNRQFDIYTPAMFGDVEPRNNIKRIGYTASGFGTTNFAKRFIRITPTGTAGLTIHLKGLSNENSEIASAFTKIVTKNPTTATKTILAIGDSLTDGKPWIAEIMRLNPNYTFVGSYTATKNDSEGNSHTFKHDGRSGWRAEQYYTGYNPSVNNFWDGSSFNFSYYVTNVLGGTAPDIVNIFLGMNDMERDLDSAVNYEKLIVDNIRSYYPNMPIIICAPQARDYNKESNVSKNGYLMMKKLYETFSAYQKLYFVPLYLLHDSENNYKIPDEYESVNPRSSIMTNKISDTVHPQDAGYWQIADAIFAALCAIN